MWLHKLTRGAVQVLAKNPEKSAGGQGTVKAPLQDPRAVPWRCSLGAASLKVQEFQKCELNLGGSGDT